MTSSSSVPDFRFETFGEPGLTAALAEATRLASEIATGTLPRWLTFCGKSGNGKTHLAKALWRWIKATQDTRQAQFSFGMTMWHWPSFVADLRSGDRRGEWREASGWPFLCVDDIGADRQTDNSAEALSTLLCARTGRWTILTTNLTARALADDLDARIVSRMVRFGGRIVELSTKDYGFRSHK